MAFTLHRILTMTDKMLEHYWELGRPLGELLPLVPLVLMVLLACVYGLVRDREQKRRWKGEDRKWLEQLKETYDSRILLP